MNRIASHYHSESQVHADYCWSRLMLQWFTLDLNLKQQEALLVIRRTAEVTLDGLCVPRREWGTVKEEQGAG